VPAVAIRRRPASARGVGVVGMGVVGAQSTGPCPCSGDLSGRGAGGMDGAAAGDLSGRGAGGTDGAAESGGS